MSFLIAMAAGLITGIISGFGVGGGTILMVYLTALCNLPQTTAQGINLFYFLPTATAALILHRKNHYVRWKAVLPAALSGCIAAGIMSFVALNMELSLLKHLFGLFLIVTGVIELFKKVS